MNTIVIKNNSKNKFCFTREHGKSVAIRPGNSIPISEMELILLSNGRAFSSGILSIVNKEAIPESIQYLFEADDAILELEDEDVKAKISGRMGDFHAYMNEVQERNEMNEKRFIFSVARRMDDLNMKKAKKIEEVTGFSFDFATEEEE